MDETAQSVHDLYVRTSLQLEALCSGPTASRYYLLRQTQVYDVLACTNREFIDYINAYDF